MIENKTFFEDRVGQFQDPCHYLNEVVDEYAKILRRKAFFNLVDVKGKNIVDFGCGVGDWCGSFIKRGARLVAGIDQSDLIIKEARRRNKFWRVSFISCQYVPYKYLADIVVMITAFNFIEPSLRRKVLLSTRDALRENGRLVILDNFPYAVPSYQRGLSYKEIWPLEKTVEFASSCGFVLEEEVPVSWVDTTLFHYLGRRTSVKIMTLWSERLVKFMPKRMVKYRILKFFKRP